MLGRVKKWLGIEGVKIDVIVPEEFKKSDQQINGTLVFESMNDQTITNIRIVLIERYARGRGKERLVDEYELGRFSKSVRVNVVADKKIEMDFTLPFNIVQSEIETFGEKNILFKGLSKVANWSRSVQSIYRIEAEVKVEGVALNPACKKEVVFV